MGLDLGLGALVLFVAIRGWLRGFVVQATRLAGLVTAVFAAVPARDFAKPYAAQYLPTIRADLSDRLLWWVSAILCYLLFVGVANLIISVSRRNTFGIPEKKRGDQFAGFGFGVVKGLIVAAFLVSALQKHAQPSIARIDWADAQAKESVVWGWSEKYQPAAKIWESQPVQLFVAHVQKYGLTPPPKADTATARAGDSEKPVQTASRAPKLSLPGTHGGPPVAADRTELDPELVRAAEVLKRHLESVR